MKRNSTFMAQSSSNFLSTEYKKQNYLTHQFSYNKNVNCFKETRKTCPELRTNSTQLKRKQIFGDVPGIDVGMSWEKRKQLSDAGGHLMPIGGIHGVSSIGAFSVVLSGGYEDDVDDGLTFIYTGSGGRDLDGNRRVAPQSRDQIFTSGNMALARNCACFLSDKGGDAGKNWRKGKPVRVFRSFRALNHSAYAPAQGIRYDGLYKVKRYWKEKGLSGFLIWRYLLERDDPRPAPWTDVGQKRIKNLGYKMVESTTSENCKNILKVKIFKLKNKRFEKINKIYNFNGMYSRKWFKNF